MQVEWERTKDTTYFHQVDARQFILRGQCDGHDSNQRKNEAVKVERAHPREAAQRIHAA